MGDGSPPQDPNTVRASVQIRRSVDEVFAFYRDFANLPRFLGDVMAVEPLAPTLSRWTIQGPFGLRVSWIIKLAEARANEVIRYHTVGFASLSTHWDIQFSPTPDGETEVREVMTIPFGAAGRAMLMAIGKSPAAEVRANLQRLKEVLETGRVTNTDHAVAGKFPGVGL
jgi:uncharacterized membrane protein